MPYRWASRNIASNFITRACLPAALNNEVVAVANFVLGDVRLNRQEVWMGRYRYVLRRVDGELKMVQKKVMLLGDDMPVGNLTFIV